MRATFALTLAAAVAQCLAWGGPVRAHGVLPRNVRQTGIPNDPGGVYSPCTGGTSSTMADCLQCFLGNTTGSQCDGCCTLQGSNQVMFCNVGECCWRGAGTTNNGDEFFSSLEEYEALSNDGFSCGDIAASTKCSKCVIPTDTTCSAGYDLPGLRETYSGQVQCASATSTDPPSTEPPDSAPRERTVAMTNPDPNNSDEGSSFPVAAVAAGAGIGALLLLGVIAFLIRICCVTDGGNKAPNVQHDSAGGGFPPADAPPPALVPHPAQVPYAAESTPPSSAHGYHAPPQHAVHPAAPLPGPPGSGPGEWTGGSRYYADSSAASQVGSVPLDTTFPGRPGGNHQ